MPCNACMRRNNLRRPGPAAGAANTVITNRMDCCTTQAENTTELLYSGSTPEILVTGCCDNCNGCSQYNAEHRCKYWPSFAHPRWLSCQELYNERNRTDEIELLRLRGLNNGCRRYF